MSRRFFLIFTVLTLATASFMATIDFNRVEANSTLKNKINTIQGERSETQDELGQKQNEINEVKAKAKKLEAEIRVLDDQTADTNQKIRTKDSEISESKAGIEELIEEIRILEERIAERDDLLKKRVRSMYKNGGSVNYLEVILGAQDFGDLINRITALSTIAQQDHNILEAHHNDKIMVEEAKLLMEQKHIALEAQLEELESLKAALEQQTNEKDRVMGQLKEHEGELNTQLVELEEADNILAAQERAMKAELKAWQERERQIEAERKRRQQAENNPNPSGGKPSPQNGILMRPATGSVTSPYGPRWGQFHHGVDIGKNGRSGHIPIVAAAGGTVVRSYYSGSYGNAVIVSHIVGGKVLTTLYAHMENRLVADGQSVSQGQILGYMGNTGNSFGAHLHFEVHEGPWNGARSNSVNPMRYIN